MSILTREEVEKLSTDKILNIYRRERYTWAYPNGDFSDNYFAFEKEMELHQDYMEMLKEVLSTREHVPRKQEAKEERQRLAKKNRGGRRSHKKKTR